MSAKKLNSDMKPGLSSPKERRLRGEAWKPGKVIIAGAGPGDADLITVKLQKKLKEADVIITDRLVNPTIIDENAKKDAEIIFTGKQGYHDGSVSQEEINQLIVRHALAGKRVLRLKGGDVAFFSNVLDELRCLTVNEIEFEIIPGITASSGASAYAGIPLTARGFSRGVQVLTLNQCSQYTPEIWKRLANSSDTLVFYMAAKHINDLDELLLRYTRKPNTPIAVIEQATTIHQKVHISTLKNCVRDFSGKNFSSPSLIIIGKVVNLYQQFNWFKSGEEGSVFNELAAAK
ncbi:MAG TPA: uroporphyrinogen-III C-methyltransferase [Chitinophagaceae bacterium]|jgi:uroporphyrin-III C-methyltransferase|nr:uroporphyrinogen-III C-methyltransferase [Chitinophagaceae bacterium]